MKKYAAFSAVFVCAAAAVVALLYLTPLPQQDAIAVNYPEQHIIEKANLCEVQGYNQCSAFAAAYVLRHYGFEAAGKEIYAMMPTKIPFGPWKGYTLPKGVLKVIAAHKLKPALLTGNLETLKTRLTAGTPVIVIVGNGFRWQHYMTLVGYDERKGEMYFYDSGQNGDINAEQPGNRTITEEYFLELWDNGLPVLNHVYIAVEK